jgi:4-hydroxybenzoate polyprenyltransferase
MNSKQPTRLPARGTGRVRAYVELLRLPAVFTAMADVAMGFLFTHPTLEPWRIFLALWLASSSLYLAGMVLNDVFDSQLDARERPNRPIPSGRIARASAARLGGGLLVFGVVAGWVASGLSGRVEPGAIATALAAMILLYDAALKSTVLGPVAMGSCRFLNVLLGMSAVGATLPHLPFDTAWRPAALIVALGIGIYIAGVTWFARTEAGRSERSQLLTGTIVMLAGMGLVARYPAWIQPPLEIPEQWNLFWLLIGAVIGVRCVRAISDPQSGMVQVAVKNCLLSLIVIDAAVVMGMDGQFWACMVLLLVAPAMLLGRWISST